MDLHPCFVDCRAIDDQWYVNLGSKRRRKRKPTKIDFDVPITPYPEVRRLTDPEFERDLITIKTIVNESVQPRPRGWIAESSGLVNLLKALISFTRARIDMGIRSNSELGPEAKRTYLNRLEKGGYFNTIRFSERTEAIISGFERGQLAVPINARKQIDVSAIASLFGVQHSSAVPQEELDRVKEYLRGNEYVFRDHKSRITKRRPSARKLSAGRVRDIVVPWFLLFKCRTALSHDPIPFRPFLNPKEIEATIKKWTKKKGSTKELRPNQVVDLLSKSLALLTDPLTDFVIKIVSGFKPRFLISPSERAFINLRLAALDLGIIGDAFTQDVDLSESASLRTLAFVLIPTAAACVLAMGTARRNDEIDSQEVGCVTTDDLAQLWLRTPVRKQKGRGVGKDGHTTKIPISHTVKLAIDTMEKLKAATGDTSAYLFDLQDRVLGTRVGFKLTTRIKELARWLRVVPADDGSVTEFAAHQFRKFFAITYFYRYKFPSLPALSLHMMHLNLDVTRAYLASAARNSLILQDEALASGRRWKATPVDVSRLEDFEEVGRGFVLDIMLSAMKGETKLGGTAGLHLMRDLAKLTEQLSDIVDVQDSVEADEALNALIGRFASHKTFRPHPEGHGFCACDKSTNCLLAANCLKNKSVALGVEIRNFGDIDLSYAEDLTCGTCIHHFILPELWPYWENEISRCETVLEQARGEQGVAIQERLDGLKNYESSVTWQWAA